MTKFFLFVLAAVAFSFPGISQAKLIGQKKADFDTAKLAADPKSDLSNHSDQQIALVADLEAKVYAAANPGHKYYFALSKISKKKAFAHNLIGDKANYYETRFTLAVDSLPGFSWGYSVAP